MNKNTQNFWIDLGLLVLLTVTILAASVEIFIPCFVHVSLGLLLSLAALTHVALHWKWIKHVLTRFDHLPAEVRTSFLLNLALFLAYSTAGAMGLIARATIFLGPLRHVLGFFHFSLVVVLLGLQTLHLIRHWKWINTTAQKVLG